MKLEDIFPPKDCSDSEIDCLVYSRDASGKEGSCKAVVWPTTLDHIYHLVHWVRRMKETITIRGAATNTVGGCVPKNSIVVDMSKMNKIISIGTDTVTVDAGVVIDDLNRAIEKRIFPIIPLEHSVCTIGGMIAANTYGLDTGLGRIQDWIVSVEIVDGTGKHVTFSGSSILDVAGKEGVTGIICRATLKTIPRLQIKSFTLLQFNTLTAMMDQVNGLMKDTNTNSIEYFDEYCSGLMGFDKVFHILIEYRNESGEITNRDEVEKIEELKENIRHLLTKQHYTQQEYITIPLENMAKLFNWLQKNGTPCFGNINLQIIHPCFKEYSKLPGELLGVIEKLKGKQRSDFPIGITRKHILTAQEKEKILSLKRTYDPQWILNNGVLIDEVH